MNNIEMRKTTFKKFFKSFDKLDWILSTVAIITLILIIVCCHLLGVNWGSPKPTNAFCTNDNQISYTKPIEDFNYNDTGIKECEVINYV